jgi:hypothetical protein
MKMLKSKHQRHLERIPVDPQEINKLMNNKRFFRLCFVT